MFKGLSSQTALRIAQVPDFGWLLLLQVSS
jgi:hypothetical protein